MSGVSEDTAKRIADALERLAKVMEGDPAIPTGYLDQAALSDCFCPANTVCMKAICPRRRFTFGSDA